MNVDGIEVTILADGTIKISTDKISQANHGSADKLLAMLAELTGGPVKVLKDAHTHIHLGAALHAHASDGHTH